MLLKKGGIISVIDQLETPVPWSELEGKELAKIIKAEKNKKRKDKKTIQALETIQKRTKRYP